MNGALWYYGLGVFSVVALIFAFMAGWDGNWGNEPTHWKPLPDASH